ncbi:MAG: histidine phosphatase family protein [Dehalococcoidia bacterium]|nr:histidine phosphatase family protein [Dehalococcoidia bacterium]
MTLLFVRHGQSEGNARRIMQGWLDTPLSDLGRSQAEVVARRLATSGATRIYASPLMRAWETARPVGVATGLDVEPLDGLREYNYGEAQGLTWDEVESRWGVSVGKWGTGSIPGEEGTVAFHARVTAAFEELAERHRDDTAIVVSHGGTIARLIVHVLAAPRESYLPFATPANTSITAFAWERGRHTLVSLNDSCHLSEVREVSERVNE